MTIPLRFCDTIQVPAGRAVSWSSPAKAFCIAPGYVALPPMAPAPNPGPSATTLAAGLAAIGFWRLSAVAAPHMAALAIMLETEADFGGRIGFALAWGILNFFFIALLRRPALSGALSLTLGVGLVLLSRVQHDAVPMTANLRDR